MSEAYTVFWPQDRWSRAATVTGRLTVLFGGPHTSEPSFRRATVRPDDVVYPIGVRDGVLYVFGRMRVQEIVAVDGPDGERSLEEYLTRYAAWRFLAPTCTDEVVLGTGGTGIHLDRPLPPEMLKRMTYAPRRGPRPVRYVTEDGRLARILSIQGIYRLAESSVADLEAVLAGPPGPPVTRPRSRRATSAAPGVDEPLPGLALVMAAPRPAERGAPGAGTT